MDGNKVVLVLAPDWQMIYVNGKLELQDHRLQLQDVLPVFIREQWFKGIQFHVKEVGFDWIEPVPIEINNSEFLP